MTDDRRAARVAIIDNSIDPGIYKPVERGFKGRDSLLEALRCPPRDSGLIHRIVRTFLAVGPLTGGNR